MKYYKVYYIIKKNGHGYLNETEVQAKNQKEAIAKVRADVRERTGRNAFSATCKAPAITKYGLYWNGGTYTRYSELFHMLW